MLLSHSIPLGEINLSQVNRTHNVSMMPFDLATLQQIPKSIRAVIQSMINKLPSKIGTAYVTIDCKNIQPNTTHRRGGAHIDGNYIIDKASWGGSGGGGNGWKVGDNGKTLSQKAHDLSYNLQTGGMVIASSHSACIGWNVPIVGKAGIGGSCSHLEQLKSIPSFMLKADTIYYGTSQFIHESIPVEESVNRTLVRITLPSDYPYQFKL